MDICLFLEKMHVCMNCLTPKIFLEQLNKMFPQSCNYLYDTLVKISTHSTTKVELI